MSSPDNNTADIPSEKDLYQYKLGLCNFFFSRVTVDLPCRKPEQMCSVCVEIGAFLSNLHRTDTFDTD